jgi:hypothetical protein
MQASTSEQFAISVMLEQALCKVMMSVGVSDAELEQLGFNTSLGLKERLLSFVNIQSSLDGVIDNISKFTDLEHQAYVSQKHAFYMA